MRHTPTRKKPGPKPREHAEPVAHWQIKDFPVDLRERLKIAAALRRTPLRSFVIETLEREISQ